MNMRSLLPSLWHSNNNHPDALQALRQEIDRTFDSFARGLPSVSWPADAVVPKVNVTQNEKMVSITAELPGVDLKEVELLVDDDLLTIKGEKKAEKEEKDAERHVFECSYGAFTRTIQLPFDVDANTVNAAFKNGILTVTIPVPANVQPRARKVEIKAAA
ncbi:MAG: Hsp20/alpha crystallin family protein [Beijerinckiaceae bacterium]